MARLAKPVVHPSIVDRAFPIDRCRESAEEQKSSAAGAPSPVPPSVEAEIDPDLIRAVRQGDGEATEKLIRLFAPKVRRLAMRYFASPFDQEEAVQEALLLIFRQRERLDPLRSESVRSFVATVARRRMIDLLRARGAAPAGDEGLEAAEDVPDDVDVHAAAERAELARVIEAFEARLKPAYRPFFKSVFVEGRDFDEARVQLGIGALRARYLKKVLVARLRRHGPLLELLGRMRAPARGDAR